MKLTSGASPLRFQICDFIIGSFFFELTDVVFTGSVNYNMSKQKVLPYMLKARAIEYNADAAKNMCRSYPR